MKKILSISLSLLLIICIAVPTLNFSAAAVIDNATGIQKITFTDAADVNGGWGNCLTIDASESNTSDGSGSLKFYNENITWCPFTPNFTYEMNRKYKISYWHKELDETPNTDQAYSGCRENEKTLVYANYSTTWDEAVYDNWTYTGTSLIIRFYPTTTDANSRGVYTSWIDDVTLTPYYKFAVGTATGGSGQVSVSEALAGTSVTFTATADSGYKFVEWQKGGVAYSTEKALTVENVSEDLNLTPVFALQQPYTKNGNVYTFNFSDSRDYNDLLDMMEIKDGVLKIKNVVDTEGTNSEVSYTLPATFSTDSEMLRLQYTYSVPQTDDVNWTGMAYFESTGWDSNYTSKTMMKRYVVNDASVDTFLPGDKDVALHIYKNLNLDFTINSLVITEYKENDVNGDTEVDIRDLFCYKKSQQQNGGTAINNGHCCADVVESSVALRTVLLFN